MGSKVVYYTKTEMYKRLKDEEEIFDTYKDVLLFLASVGYSKDNKGDLPSGGNEIAWEYIARDPTQHIFVKCMAYADTEDKEALSDTDRQIDILLKYADGGEDIIKEEVLDNRGDVLENLVEYLKENRKESVYGEDSGILRKIREEVESVT